MPFKLGSNYPTFALFILPFSRNNDASVPLFIFAHKLPGGSISLAWSSCHCFSWKHLELFQSLLPLSVMSTQQLIYYADNTRRVISRVSLNGAPTEQIVVSNGLGEVQGLAVDWISGNVFFSDSTHGTIRQYHPTSGAITTVLSGLDQPRSIAVYPDAPHKWVTERDKLCNEFSLPYQCTYQICARCWIKGNKIVIKCTELLPWFLHVDIRFHMIAYIVYPLLYWAHMQVCHGKTDSNIEVL